MSFQINKSTLKWKKWQNAVFERNGAKLSKKVLVEKEGSYEDLVDELMVELIPFSSHLFNAKWQYQQFNHLKNDLPPGWLLTISDFAENYRCCHQDEISSAYYTYKQATLFPIMSYYHCPDEGCDATIQEAVVIVSDDLDHDAHSVKHFKQVLYDHLEEKGVSWTHHVSYSDGSASQFKSKVPFHYLKHSPTSMEQAFFGSRHGKSPCDGIGGTVKKMCPRPCNVTFRPHKGCRRILEVWKRQLDNRPPRLETNILLC